MGNSFQATRLTALGAVMLTLLFGLFIRLVSLQLMSGERYRRLAEGNRERVIPIAAERGLIMDRRGVTLTENIPKFSLALTPQLLPKDPAMRRAVVNRIREITNRPLGEIAALIEEYSAYSFESIIIADNIDYDTALRLQISAFDLPALSVTRGSKRLYVLGNQAPAAAATSTPRSLAHVLGYEGKLSKEELAERYRLGYLPSDVIGKTGIEKTYETELRGTHGNQRVEVNALGREQTVLSERAPIPGKHVRLSIDGAMQQKLERDLADALQGVKRRRGAAIAMNPNNGEVLALVSLPGFDNNDFSGTVSSTAWEHYLADADQPLFNRAIGGLYPSGSAIKPAIAAVALQEGIITPETSVLSSGGIQVGPSFFPDWLPGGHGRTDVRKSLAQSVNTFYYYIGGGYGKFRGLGISKLIPGLEKFGFGARLGIDLSGEREGLLPTPAWKKQTQNADWYIGDTYNVSIGEGDLLVTPLQIAGMTAVVANGGNLYRPHLVSATVDAISGRQTPIAPEIVRHNVVQPDDLNIVRLGMRDCVVSGSCRRLNSLPLAVAGKTGTAQWSKTRETHAWFTSFAPYEHPEIVLTILIEEGGEGSRTAVPVAEKFYRWWFANHKS